MKIIFVKGKMIKFKNVINVKTGFYFSDLYLSKSITFNECGFTPFVNDECQSLLKSTSMGSHPLLMVDVKSTAVNENIFLLC